VGRAEGPSHLVSILATMGVPGVSPQSTQSTAAVMQEVLELLPEAALRLPWRLMAKMRVRAASTASAGFPSILCISRKPCGQQCVPALLSCIESAGVHRALLLA
jgi:hypothetical protein